MNEDEPPGIEFPCADYPIKIFLEGDDQCSIEAVYTIVRRHTTEFNAASATQQWSRNGRFVSLTVAILATGEAQLKALHSELLAHEQVRLVL